MRKAPLPCRLGIFFKYVKYLLMLILLTSSSFSYAGLEEWEIVKLEEELHKDVPFRMPKQTNIVFSNGRKFSTKIVEFKLLATIQTEKEIPFLIFSGRSCVECDMNTSIYIHSPLISTFKGDQVYSYPGKEYYYMDNSLLQESRMFYGQCIKEETISVIWYSKYLGEDNKWHKITYPIQFKGKEVKTAQAKYTQTALNLTLDFVKKGICFEVKGIERSSEP